MSMTHSGGFTEYISETIVVKVVGEELIKDLDNALNIGGLSREDMYHDGLLTDGVDYYAELGDDEARVAKAYQSILDKFHEETGMELFGAYLDSETDSCDLETETFFWEVDHSDLWVKSPSFKAFEEKFGTDTINRSFFASFG